MKFLKRGAYLLPHLWCQAFHRLDVVERAPALVGRHPVQLLQAPEQPLLLLRSQPAEAWLILQSLFLLLRGQVPVPLQPRAEVCLLIAFKSWSRPLLRRAGKTRRQGEYQQKRREHTSSQLPAKGFTFELVVDCHSGALRSGYVPSFAGASFPGLLSY